MLNKKFLFVILFVSTEINCPEKENNEDKKITSTDSKNLMEAAQGLVLLQASKVENKYFCSYCQKSYKHKRTLKVHFNEFHPDKKFPY